MYQPRAKWTGEILDGQQLPAAVKTKWIWKQRFEQINCFERYLVENGIIVLKFFLNVSKKEQKKRFLERLEQENKNWKLSVADAREREHWDDYMAAYEDVFSSTSTKWAPWYIGPADNKWFMRVAVAAIIYQTLQGLNLKYPTVSADVEEASASEWAAATTVLRVADTGLGIPSADQERVFERFYRTDRSRFNNGTNFI